MKKYLLSTFAVLAAATMATAASAQTSYYDDMYVRVDAGYSIGMKRTENAANFDAGVGFRLNDYFKTDLTAQWRPWGKQEFKDHHVKVGKGDMWTLGAMANVYGSYPVYDKFSLYATGGVGYSYNKVDNFSGYKGEGKSNFAWNVGAGVEYALTPCVSLDLGYRYTDLGDARAKNKATGTKLKEDVKYNDIKIGLTYFF